MKRLEGCEGEWNEEYEVTEGALQFSSYIDHLIEGVEAKPEPFTLLSALQADLLFLRDPKTEKIEFREDRSIQVHAAPNPLREVEALYQTLAAALREDPCLKPRDMVVLVSDLSLYEPLIRIVFGSEEGGIKAEIGEGGREKAPLIAAFQKWLDLAQSRFDKKEVLECFEEPLFLAKRGLTKEDFGHFADMAEENKISFGIDREQRRAYFGSFADDGERGTWRCGFKSYLKGLANGDKGGYGRAEAVGSFIALFEEFIELINPILKKHSLPISEWGSILKQILDSFFDCNQAHEEAEYLIRVLNGMQMAWPTTFPTLYTHLKRELSKSGFLIQSEAIQAVRFCSLLPMRSIPAKVVALLGMSQGAVPKPQRKSALDRLQELFPLSEKPASSDFDRYLFLESLLSAREKWLLFFSESKESKDPSIVVEELISYIDSGYVVDGKKPSESLLLRHPAQGFHKNYFSQGTVLKNVSQKEYEAAVAYYNPQKRSLEAFTFKAPVDASVLEAPLEIPLKELKALLSHPIKLYQKEKLGVKIDKEKAPASRLEDLEEEEYLKYTLERYAASTSIEEALERGIVENLFPDPPFREAAVSKYRKKLQELFKANPTGEPIFEVEFAAGYERPEQVDEKLWRVPAAEVVWNGKKVAITGHLSRVTRKGLLAFKEHSQEEEMKQKAEHWMLHALPEGFAEKKVIYSDREVEVKPPNWELLVEHYLRSKEQPTPFLPEWAEALIAGDHLQLAKKIEGEVNPDFYGKKNESFVWALKNSTLPKAEEIIDLWREKAIELFEGDSP